MIKTISKEEALRSLSDAIEENNLVILSGAGLSRAIPSNLPSAAELAHKIAEKARAADEAIIPDALEDLADYFINKNRFYDYFIRSLVPTEAFASKFNLGHLAIADFLTCKAIASTISTNYDTLIEDAGHSINGEIEVHLDGAEAARSLNSHPLLKIHGCWSKAKEETIWSPKQLEDEPIKERIRKSKEWLTLNLANKHLLIIGFWSDWDHINSILSSTLGTIAPSTITIADLSITATLIDKAPKLCAISDADPARIKYQHVQISGAELLDDLRKQFSQRYFRKVLSFGRAAFLDEPGTVVDEGWLKLPDHFDSETLYAIRRDLEGKEPNEPATMKEPSDHNTILGSFILRLRWKGAVPELHYWSLASKKIRVIMSNKTLNEIKRKFEFENNPISAADFVVCVGAQDTGLASNWARPNEQSSTVRGGSDSSWLTRDQASKILGV